MNLLDPVIELLRILIFTFEVKHSFVGMSTFLEPDEAVSQWFASRWILRDLATAHWSVVGKVFVKLKLSHVWVEALNHDVALLLLIWIVRLRLIFERLLSWHQNILFRSIQRAEFLKPLIEWKESQLKSFDCEILELVLRLLKISLALELDGGWPKWFRVLIIFFVFLNLDRGTLISVRMEKSSHRFVCKSIIFWNIVDLSHDIFEVLWLGWWSGHHRRLDVCQARVTSLGMDCWNRLVDHSDKIDKRLLKL